MNLTSRLSASGSLNVRFIGGPPTVRQVPLAWKLRNTLRRTFVKGWLACHVGVPLARLLGFMSAVSELRAVKTELDGSKTDYGVVGYRVVTNALVAFVVDQLQVETSIFGDFKYHDSGVGVTAENAADTIIETTDAEARATGTQTESAANAYRSVGTITYTTTKAITEHGLFNDLTAGTLMDRTVFTAINVANTTAIGSPSPTPSPAGT